jgi:hypothetical protein
MNRVTRRIVLGAGLAFSSLACTAAVGAYSPSSRRRDAPAIDALLIDETIAMPRDIAVMITANRWNFPIFGIQLDAATQARLKPVLHESRTVAGISSGATLFCVERIAWDHGFRLLARSERRGDPNQYAQDVAEFLRGTVATASTSALARTYRPSRADATLHTWVMQKKARPQLRQGPREV